MVLLEGLKKLKLIEKRMVNNADNISRYSSRISTEMPLLQTDEAMKAKVQELLQSNKDLMKEYLDLKRKIDHANNTAKVTVMDKEFTINDLLAYQRKLTSLMKKTYFSMNTRYADEKVNAKRNSDNTEVVVLFDETCRLNGLDYWAEFEDMARSALELANATVILE